MKFSVVMKHVRGTSNRHIFTVRARDLPRTVTTPRRANDAALRLHPDSKVLFVRDNLTGRAIA